MTFNGDFGDFWCYGDYFGGRKIERMSIFVLESIRNDLKYALDQKSKKNLLQNFQTWHVEILGEARGRHCETGEAGFRCGDATSRIYS